MKKTLFPRIPLVLGVGLALLALLASFSPPAGPALAEVDPEVCVYKELGTRVNLTISGHTYYNQWVGLFRLTVGGESYDGWCIDLEHGIRSGQCFDATLTDALRKTPWCQIGYIMTNYSPSSGNEAAAIQLALWKCKYGKDYVKVSHSGIESMALAIYTDAQGECPRVIAGYSQLTLEPDGELVVSGGVACQKFTATVTDSGDIPLQGIQVQFEATKGSFSPPNGTLLTVPTDGNGEASVTLCWDASQEGSLTAYTEGYWPVIIYPTGSIQETIILQHRELSAEESIAWQQAGGSLEVTKTVDWNGATPDTGQTFEICITGPSYPTGNCKTADYDGEVLTWTNLIPGDYTVTETSAGTKWSVVVPPGSVAVVTDETATATVTNTYKRGSLEVTKTVDWDGATPDTGQTFEICITGPSYPSGDCKTADYDGEELTWTNLIPGDYTVTETSAGTKWTVVVTGSPATVVAGDKATANVTNTYKRGSLEVTKTVNWDDVTPDTTKTFEICITGPSYPTGNCKTADYDGEVLTWTNLIPGDYTVTETGPGSEWTVVVTGGSPATVVSGETASASVTNTYGCVARIEGHKFANQCCSNGKWDWGEPPVAGWEIYLIDYAHYILGDYTSKITTTTDANGLFCFEGVTSGLYVVFEEHRSGWTACTYTNSSIGLKVWPLRDWYVVYVSAADCGQTITGDVYGYDLLFGNKPSSWPPKSATAMSPQGSWPAEGPVCD